MTKQGWKWLSSASFACSITSSTHSTSAGEVRLWYWSQRRFAQTNQRGSVRLAQTGQDQNDQAPFGIGEGKFPLSVVSSSLAPSNTWTVYDFIIWINLDEMHLTRFTPYKPINFC